MHLGLAIAANSATAAAAAVAAAVVGVAVKDCFVLRVDVDAVILRAALQPQPRLLQLRRGVARKSLAVAHKGGSYARRLCAIEEKNNVKLFENFFLLKSQ